MFYIRIKELVDLFDCTYINTETYLIYRNIHNFSGGIYFDEFGYILDNRFSYTITKALGGLNESEKINRTV